MDIGRTRPQARWFARADDAATIRIARMIVGEIPARHGSPPAMPARLLRPDGCRIRSPSLRPTVERVDPASPAGLLTCGCCPRSPSRHRFGGGQWLVDRGRSAYSCGGSLGIGDLSPHRVPVSPLARHRRRRQESMARAVAQARLALSNVVARSPLRHAGGAPRRSARRLVAAGAAVAGRGGGLNFAPKGPAIDRPVGNKFPARRRKAIDFATFPSEKIASRWCSISGWDYEGIPESGFDHSNSARRSCPRNCERQACIVNHWVVDLGRWCR